MKPTRSILKAISHAFRRRQKSIRSLAANNLQYAALTFLFLGDPAAGAFFVAVIGVVLILPMSADPLCAVPVERLRSWPLEKRELRMLRIASPWLNPMTWLLVALAFWKRIALSLWIVIAGPALARSIVPPGWVAARSVVWRNVPRLPGPIGILIRKDLRQLFSTLDFWVAMVIAVPGLAARSAGLLPRESLVPLTLILMLALSTCAQSLFGLDREAGMTRYRVLPTPGWQILAAKDIAFLLTAIVLSLPLSPLCGAAAALAGLTVGHGGSVWRIREESRWRFQTSPSFGASAAQMAAMAGAGSAAALWNPIVLPVCAAACGWSAWQAGRRLEAGERNGLAATGTIP